MVNVSQQQGKQKALFFEQMALLLKQGGLLMSELLKWNKQSLVTLKERVCFGLHQRTQPIGDQGRSVQAQAT